ncbi:MAG: PRC-barrel domain-containing protein [Pseudomonadota bacterium]
MATETTDIVFTAEQPASSLMASELIGETVLSTTGEKLGDINDLVLSSTGRIEHVVIGVGGVLGISEKEIAIPFDMLVRRTGTDDAATLEANLTEGQLRDAPEFTTTGGYRSGAIGKFQARAEQFGDQAKEVFSDVSERTKAGYEQAKSSLTSDRSPRD